MKWSCYTKIFLLVVMALWILETFRKLQLQTYNNSEHEKIIDLDMFQPPKGVAEKTTTIPQQRPGPLPLPASNSTRAYPKLLDTTHPLPSSSSLTNHTKQQQTTKTATLSTTERCPSKDFIYLKDRNVASSQQQTSLPFRIPLVLYQTGPSRCITTSMYEETVSKWHSDDNNNLAYRFYDDPAMDEMLYDPKFQKKFPTLPLALQCIEHANIPVMKADIWRYLVLWEKGGIFADLDVAPSSPDLTKNIIRHDHNHNNDTLIRPDDDAVFVRVQAGPSSVISQWFIAVSPRHPLMHYAIQIAANSVVWAKRTLPLTHTGPQALYSATKEFLKDTDASERGLEAWKRYYDHSNQSSFFVLPEYFAKNLASPSKEKSYNDMNMTHYWHSMKAVKYNNKRCFEFLGGTSMGGRTFELNGTVYDLDKLTTPF